MLEAPFVSDSVDGKFVNGEFVQIRGRSGLAEFLRVDEIDAHTRAKILFLGDHYPYDFYPEEGGLLYIGRTDDEDFFLRMDCGKQTIVMYSDGYYEFDMTITEFIYEYLTCAIRIPMGHEEDEWEFVPFNKKTPMYKLRFFFEWGMDTACLWCGNQTARDRFDVGPIDFNKLGLSEDLQETLRQLGDEYQDSLDWNDPLAPSSWTQEHKDDFLRRSEEVYKRLVAELGEDYEVTYAVGLPE